MFSKTIGAWLAGALLALTVAGPATADDLQRMQAVDGMNVFLGVMPAAAIRAGMTGEVETAMHGGIPAGHDIHHVLVTLFDRESGERIENATVTARVIPLGLVGKAQPLEIMYSAGVACYCNWFDMPAGDTYRISVLIERPDRPAQRTQFEYMPN